MRTIVRLPPFALLAPMLIAVCQVPKTWCAATATPTVRCVAALTSAAPLPYEHLGVLIEVRNAGADPATVWRDAATLRVGHYEGGAVVWRPYFWDLEGSDVPPPRRSVALAPGERLVWALPLEYDRGTHEHVFACPGRYFVGARAGDLECAPVALEVETPHGKDAAAYAYLQKSTIHQLFGERTVSRYPYDRAGLDELQRFIARFWGSRYVPLARLGLGIACINGLDGKRQLEKAEAVLTRLATTEKDPVASRAYYYLGIAYEKAGQRKRSMDAFRRAVQGQPDPYFRYLAEEALQLRLMTLL